MVSEEAEKKIVELQTLEQNLQLFALQKQKFQTSLNEIENALEDLKTAKGETFKIIGNVMVAVDKDQLVKELNEKKSVLELRIKNIENQEEKLKEKAAKLQSEVMEKLKNEKK